MALVTGRAPRAGTSAPHAAPSRGPERTRSVDVERALVEAANAVLVRDGPAGVTVRAVAREAGVAPMGVYNHLGGKDGLVAALLVRGFDRLRETLEQGREPDPVERLRACGLRYREFALSNPQHYAVMFEGALAVEVESPVVQEHASPAFGALVDKVAYAMARGAIPEGDAFDSAQQIWAAVHGAVALELQGLVLTPDPAATYERLVELVIRGVTARP
jgi:AcrR family transcriptional regulator